MHILKINIIDVHSINAYDTNVKYSTLSNLFCLQQHTANVAYYCRSKFSRVVSGNYFCKILEKMAKDLPNSPYKINLLKCDTRNV